MAEETTNAVVSFGNLGPAAKALVEKVSDAVGGIAKPWQLKRLAAAEAEASLIRAQGEIEVTDLQRRAMIRFVQEEARRQKNIEDITTKALPDVSEDAKPEQIENDWLTNFFEKARLISDEQMQSLWARVLAGEANTPGRFSRRTATVLADLEKVDAEMFTKLCGFAIHVEMLVPLVGNVEHPIYKENGLSFGKLIHLDSIGLIRFDHLGEFAKSGIGKEMNVYYFGQEIVLKFSKETGNSLPMGKVSLTRTGHDLAQICGAKPVPGFLEYLRQRRWKHLMQSEGEA